MGSPLPKDRDAAREDFAGRWVRHYVTANFPSDVTILDVGAGWGKYRDLLPDHTMDACEIWQPYVDEECLEDRYRNVFVGDVCDLQFESYDIIIMGDVFEHIEADRARALLDRILPVCQELIVVVPFQMEQGEEDDNPYEVHRQADLTPRVMKERFPELGMVVRDEQKGVFIKGARSEKVGFVGLGKLGLPCALAVEEFGGHEVYGTDPSGAVVDILRSRRLPYKEGGAQELLDRTDLRFVRSVEEVVANCDLIFVPIQTPHQPEYEGITPIPDTRSDFNYEYLKAGMAEVATAAARLKKKVTVVVISTVLPGTLRREVVPLLNEYVNLCYNPFFIAMGTTVHDFTHPEFVLFGSDDPDVAARVEGFYRTIHNRPVFHTSVESAELIKVAYNTFIGMKIVFANTMMEICHKTDADVDDVSAALALATDRLLSPKYLKGGMGDSGGCHPRDNIAMSWLSRELDLSYDFFSSLMLAREEQTRWLADLIVAEYRNLRLPVVIMGYAYKPETNLVVGSAALLLKELLKERGVVAELYDPCVTANPYKKFHQPAVFFIGTNHSIFADWVFPTGSVVLDPWGYIPDQTGVEVTRIGRK